MCLTSCRMKKTSTKSKTKPSELAQVAYSEAFRGITGKRPDEMTIQECRLWAVNNNTTLTQIDARSMAEAANMLRSEAAGVAAPNVRRKH